MNGSPEPPNAPPATTTPSAPSPPRAGAEPSPANAPASPAPAVPPAAAAQPAAEPRPATPAAPRPAARATPAPSLPAAAQTRYAAPSAATPGSQRKSPVIAGLLSLMPGVGQLYVGYYKLGFIHNVVFGTTITLLAAGGGPFLALVPAMAIFLPFFVIYSIVDASRRANLYNLALDGGEGIDLPSIAMDISLPSLEGSIGGAVILIVLGVVLLSNTLFGIPLDWLAAWWPVIPLGLGVHLLVKALKERQAGQ